MDPSQTDSAIAQAVADEAASTVELRRDFHRHPEVGWAEFRTTALIRSAMEALEPARLLSGQALYEGVDRLGVPDADVLDASRQRAIGAGIEESALSDMDGGRTGLCVEFTGARPGPVVAIRADIDALPLPESDAAEHYPAREGFRSDVDGVMHACAHDAHAAVAISVARILNAMQDRWSGTVRLLFQPAEEGTRGADAFVRRGLLDDVDAVLTFHVLSNVGLGAGEMAGAVSDMLPTEKFVVRYTGTPSQFASSPQLGRNALTVSSAVTLLAHAIPKRPGSRSMINIGKVFGGTAANIVPASAVLSGEIRADTQEDVESLREAFIAMSHGVSSGFGVADDYGRTGYATNPRCDPTLIEEVNAAAGKSGFEVRDPVPLGASDDASLMIDRVQERGGVGTYVAIGGGPYRPHHSPHFDFDDRILPAVVETLVRTVLDRATV